MAKKYNNKSNNFEVKTMARKKKRITLNNRMIMKGKIALRAGIMSNDPYDPTWHWTKTRSKIKSIVKSSEEFILEYKENGETKISLGSDLIGCSIWIGNEQLVIR